MKMLRTSLTAALLIALSGASLAIEYEHDEGTEAHVPTVVHDLLMVGPEETVDPRAIRADLDYAEQMKGHHEGAVTMSTAYLDDPRGTNPLLRKMAHGIIANQRFEIAVLEVIERHAAAGPETVLDLGFARIVRRPAGVDGLEHEWGVLKREPRGSWTWRWRPGLHHPSAT